MQSLQQKKWLLSYMVVSKLHPLRCLSAEFLNPAWLLLFITFNSIKKHLLWPLCTEACLVWPFLLTVYKCLLNVKPGQFRIRSNLRWHLEWAGPSARFFFQQFETVPRAGHSGSCLQESSGQSWIWNWRPLGPISQIFCYEGGYEFSQLLCCLRSVLCRCLSGDLLDDPGNKYD